jgi:L-iditol 2-dehydrogenase
MEWYLEKKIGGVLGHEVVGWVDEAGADAPFQAGELVFVHHHAPCMNCRWCRRGLYVHCPGWRRSNIDPGGMAEFVRVPREIASVDAFPIPDLDPLVGLFIEPLACSLKCLSNASPAAERVVVVGCGVMGLLNIQAARAQGAKEVWGVEPDPVRRESAKRMGADRVLSPDEMKLLVEGGGFDGADHVVVGPGSPEAIEQSTSYVRSGGDLILFTPTPTGVRTSLDLGDLYFREVRLVPSYSCGPVDTRRAYGLLRTGRVDPRPIVTHRFPIEQVQRAYNTAKAGGAALKVVVEFPDAKS